MSAKYTLIALMLGVLGACQNQAQTAKVSAAHKPAAAQKATTAQRVLWQSDLQNGQYRNPILHIDYSDPDVVAVNGDYYMTASSFNAAPGLPVLHSTDLLNWRLINYALPAVVPEKVFAKPQHGNGVWAPNIRYHANKFWIFYPDPDFGIYVTSADDPALEWSKPRLILAGKGLIDPTPLWDDDGQAWLLHAWAKSRAGFNNQLSLHKMDAQASVVEEQYVTVVDGNELEGYRTLEGPKFYKRNGYYYIFAPAGGVETGWQAVFRSTHIKGPYDERVVMEQGDSLINGPHQGAWVHTTEGEDWFLHFQSRKAYGRIVHLQPMQWINDWPVIGRDDNHDGIGQPVYHHAKPNTQRPGALMPQPTSDEFERDVLGLQWQWNANLQPSWYALNGDKLSLFSQPKIAETGDNLWMTPALLLQKFPAQQFEVVSKIDFSHARQAQSGLLVFGEDYAWVGVSPMADGPHIVYVQCRGARIGCNESVYDFGRLETDSLELRLVVQPGATVLFSYRTSDTGRFKVIGEQFQAIRGRWVGAKIGLFSVVKNPAEGGHIEVDYLRFSPMAMD